MSVSLYDLLDVEEDATPEQVRAAWKAAIADLDPTDRRFRAYNDAAGVLLDPGKRAAYDAELAAERVGADTGPAAEVDAAEPAEPVEPVDSAEPVEEPEKKPGAGAVATAPKMKAEPEPDHVEAEPTSAPAARTTAAGATADEPADEARPGGPRWLLVAVAAVAALSLALLVTVLLLPGSVGGSSPADREERARSAETAALSAAEAAVPVVLSYDYRTLDADFAEAESHLTDDFAAQRTELFEQEAESGMTLSEQVVNDKVVVTARVSGTGLSRVTEDGSRATVVVFVDQDSQKGKAAPRALRMWATLTMVLDDGDWLIGDICTEDDCS